VLKGISGSLKLLLAVKKEKFDIALDYSLDHRYELFCRFCGISRRIGYGYKKRGRFLTERMELSGYTDKHMVEYAPTY
jgi:ADP-heptose:LPS heptosyltransferase